MIVDYEWKAGLVFGLETDRISLVEEGEEIDFSEPQSTVINIYLGIVAIYLIF